MLSQRLSTASIKINSNSRGLQPHYQTACFLPSIQSSVNNVCSQLVPTWGRRGEKSRSKQANKQTSWSKLGRKDEVSSTARSFIWIIIVNEINCKYLGGLVIDRSSVCPFVHLLLSFFLCSLPPVCSGYLPACLPFCSSFERQRLVWKMRKLIGRSLDHKCDLYLELLIFLRHS